MNSTVLIGGDVCPTTRNSAFFSRGDHGAIFTDLLDVFMDVDACIVNLECPIIGTPAPIRKSGWTLSAPSGTPLLMKRSGISAVNLANNHILDHGTEGAINTFNELTESGIAWFGAGIDLKSASRILIKEVGRERVGFLGMAEREFCIASEDSPGAAPVSAVDFVRAIKSREAEYDHLVVLLHAGKEHVPYPSPRLQELCRFMVEQGASAVICQHSHCSGWYEEYENGLIVYGQGNLVFDQWPSKRQSFYEGYLVKLIFNDTRLTYELIPHKQNGAVIGTRLMRGKEKTDFLEKLTLESMTLQDRKQLRHIWSENCYKQRDAFFNTLRGNNGFIRKLYAKLKLANILYSDDDILKLQNMVRCETHHEVLESILEYEVTRRIG